MKRKPSIVVNNILFMIVPLFCLLQALKEELISELIIVTAFKKKGHAKGYPVGKKKKFDKTWGQFPQAKVDFIETKVVLEQELVQPTRWDYIKEHYPNFDLYIDDHPLSIEKTSKIIPNSSYVLPKFACNNYLEAPNIYHLETSATDLKKGDFAIAVLEMKNNQLKKKLKFLQIQERNS
ncbi:hypothetical protein G9A89_020566 [Geosiphon pyriformis]|nr:hypothetical protein G9A89_020566 [Geosiphon pyriformis]